MTKYALKQFVMPDVRSLSRHGLSRGHPVFSWIPAFAGMTLCAIIMTLCIIYAE